MAEVSQVCNFSVVIGFMFFPLINAYLIIKAANFSFKIIPIDNFLTHKWIIFIGKISYGIYLYHIMVKHFFSLLLNQVPFDKMGYFSKLQYNKTVILFPFITFFTILIAYFSYRFIEAPLLKLKDRYFRTPSIKHKLIAST